MENNEQTTSSSQQTPPPQQPEKEQAKQKEQVKEIHHHHYEKRGSFFPRFFWGVFVIFIGLVFLAQSIGLISGINVGEFFAKFWPVVIILVGLSIMSRGGFFAGLVSVIILMIILALMAAYIFSFPVSGSRMLRINSSEQEVQTQEISIDKQDAAKSANVNISAGAGQVNISGGSDRLVSGSLVSNFMDVETSSQISGSVQNIDIRTNGNGWNISGRYTNNLTVNLSSSTPMDVRLDAGAASQNLDFSDVQLTSLDIHAGASSINLTLGDKVDNAVVNLDSGASSVHITLPKDVGAKVKTSGGLTSKNFSDFKQVGNDSYQSNNYDQASKKVDITLRGGASSFKIDWK